MSPRVTPRDGAAALARADRATRTQSSFASWRRHEMLETRNVPLDLMAHTVSTPTEERAFWRWATARVRGEASATQMLDAGEHRALSKGTTTAGGFLVPTDFYDQVVSARTAAGVIGQVANVITTDNGTTITGLPVSTAHGVAAWTAEAGAYPTSSQDETFAQSSLGAFKGVTKIVASEELAQDSAVPFDAYLAGETGRRIAVLEEAAFAAGDGSGKPLGIAHASSGITTVTAATGSTTSFKAADIKSAFKALPAAYRPYATWLFHPDDFAELAALSVAANDALVFPTLQNAEPTLYGRPVLLHADLPTPAANARSAAFGDFRTGYTVRRVRAIGMTRLDELHSDNGQIGYKAYTRVDGRVVLADAIRLLVHSAT